MRWVSSLIVLCVVISVSGCSGNINTPVTGPKTKPIANIGLGEVPEQGSGPFPTSYCLQNQDGSWVQDIYATNGHQDNYDWGQAGGCVFRPIREAWAVLHNQALMVWKRVNYSKFITIPDLEPGLTHIYKAYYRVENPFPLPDVDWEMEWDHSVRTGTFDEPRQVLVNYNKYKGTGYIEIWRGSIVLEFVTPTITSVTVRDEINAAQTNSEDSEGTAKQVVNKVRTGDPDWDALNKKTSL